MTAGAGEVGTAGLISAANNPNVQSGGGVVGGYSSSSSHHVAHRGSGVAPGDHQHVRGGSSGASSSHIRDQTASLDRDVALLNQKFTDLMSSGGSVRSASTLNSSSSAIGASISFVRNGGGGPRSGAASSSSQPLLGGGAAINPFRADRTGAGPQAKSSTLAATLTANLLHQEFGLDFAAPSPPGPPVLNSRPPFAPAPPVSVSPITSGPKNPSLGAGPAPQQHPQRHQGAAPLDTTPDHTTPPYYVGTGPPRVDLAPPPVAVAGRGGNWISHPMMPLGPGGGGARGTPGKRLPTLHGGESSGVNTYGKNVLMTKASHEEFETRLERIDEIHPQHDLRTRGMMSSSLMTPGDVDHDGGFPRGVTAGTLPRGGKIALKPLDTDRSAPGRLEGGRLKKRHHFAGRRPAPERLPEPDLSEEEIGSVEGDRDY